MRKRSNPKLLTLSTLLGINLLTTNFFLSTPAFADDDKDANSGYTNVNRGLSGQSSAPGSASVQTRNGLPIANLDSFVYQAGAMADQIYGDEGIQGKPEFDDGFTASHRIAAGIVGARDAGLTTGHGSFMPSGSGADEFIQGNGEWCQSGPGGYDLSGVQGASGSVVGGLIGEAAGVLANSLIPGALGSMGTASLAGVGRTIGLPNSSSMGSLPMLPLPMLPGNPINGIAQVTAATLPQIADVGAVPGISNAGSGVSLSDFSSGVGGW